MTTNRTLMAFFAHPDDEAFGMAGTLRQAAERGWRTVLVCATRGEVGEISDPALATPETLGTVREGELRCAAAAMQISEVLFLDWRDSGMDGTPENADPRAFVNAPDEAIVPRLVALLRAERPELVVTFDPSGGYGHPDHLAIHRHTLAAVEAAADPARYPDAGAPFRTPRVYFVVFPRARFIEMRDAFLANGGDPAEVEQFNRDDLGYPDEQVDVEQNVAAQIDAKWQALHCHRTQFGDDGFFNRIPEELRKQLMSKETYARAYPPDSATPTSDLLAQP
jgi:LmbE family N-acetylglucosaminyl deacetylase